MTQPTDHLDDEVLSTLVDDQLLPAEAAVAQSHLGSCDLCQARADEFRSVAQLLRRLPEVDPPRDFAVGPRAIADPLNVVRLQRWYTAARVAAAALAAVFVVLSAGTLYIDSRPASSGVGEAARPQLAAAPAASNADAGASAASAPRLAPSPAAAVAAQPTQAPASARSAPSAPQADDQVAATTSVRALPTPLPTPTAILPAAAALVARASADGLDPAAPVRTAAVIVGVLAVLTLLAALAIRHRLHLHASHL